MNLLLYSGPVGRRVHRGGFILTEATSSRGSLPTIYLLPGTHFEARASGETLGNVALAKRTLQFEIQHYHC